MTEYKLEPLTIVVNIQRYSKHILKIRYEYYVSNNFQQLQLIALSQR